VSATDKGDIENWTNRELIRELYKLSSELALAKKVVESIKNNGGHDYMCPSIGESCDCGFDKINEALAAYEKEAGKKNPA